MNFKANRFRRKRVKARRRPINVLASAMTCAGLYCGMMSVFKSYDGQFASAAYLIILALVFDMLDGAVAKLTHTTSEFGKQLDSLCDLVSFGTAPAVLVHAAYLNEVGIRVGRYGAMIAIIYVICGALRLARFNVYQADTRDYFTGLPIPAAAVTIATLVLFAQYLELSIPYWIAAPLVMALAYLMVSNIRYPKDRMKAMVLAPHHAIRILFVCALVMAIVHYAVQRSYAIVLFPMAATYVLYGLSESLWRKIFYKPAPEQSGLLSQDPVAAETASNPETPEPPPG